MGKRKLGNGRTLTSVFFVKQNLEENFIKVRLAANLIKCDVERGHSQHRPFILSPKKLNSLCKSNTNFLFPVFSYYLVRFKQEKYRVVWFE